MFYFQIYSGKIQYIPQPDGLESSRISLQLQLTSSHYAGSSLAPHLTLRCIAEINKLYQQYAEIELGAPQRDPIPARGKHRMNESSKSNFIESKMNGDKTEMSS